MARRNYFKLELKNINIILKFEEVRVWLYDEYSHRLSLKSSIKSRKNFVKDLIKKRKLLKNW